MPRALRRPIPFAVTFAAALWLAWAAPLVAQPANAAPTSAGAEPAPDRAATVRQMENLIEALDATEKELAARQRELKQAPEPSKAGLEEEVRGLAARIQDLRQSLENLATGDVDLGLFDKRGEQSFDWRAELEEIVRPLLAELKALTERPRAIERLRRERAYYQARLPEAERALTIVGGLRKAAEAPRLQKELAALEDRWRTRRDYLASQLAVVEVQLEETLAPPAREPGWLAAGVREFLFGRGLSVVLALGAYALTHVSLIYGGRALARALRRARRGTGGFLARLLPLAAHALTVVVSLLVAMTVLYVRGDWLLLALLILFVVGLAFALRQSVPRYVKEARVLLNMGSVREGERVVYNGIPWKLTTLGLYSNLHNPLLTGGTVRLSIDELAGLHSRPFGRDEPYFPSREGDFVMLDEELYCKVLLQTPEVVQVEFKGAVKTLPTRTYLDKSPRNLSTRGFAVVIVFGLDYRHQAEIVGPIERQLEADIRADLQAQPFADQLRTLLVEYNEASASSLDVLVVGVFEGSAADRYWTLRRFLQRSIVRSCNRHGWTIPFPQLTVHAPPGTWSAPGTDRQ